MAGSWRGLAVFLDGTGWPASLEGKLDPLAPQVVSVEPWPASLDMEGESPLLKWLGGGSPGRPILGLTARMLRDEGGFPLRGASILGAGVAAVSARGLNGSALLSTVRHELGHAVGLVHCPTSSCALNERLWPSPAEDRGESFCSHCADHWLEALSAFQLSSSSPFQSGRTGWNPGRERQ